ncbi:MAG: asparagine synthase (glutamine-hydrolyzing), partial [Acidobacteriota bacterium]|nr:asparagine synthase (glutamine-hydrolyzing) [Acidobacteriota bacterium]
LSLMTDAQTHRGPDDRGTFERRTKAGGWVGLGSRRLSILDLSPAGHMPMATQDGRLTIAYNGEVYNYPQLRRDLEAKGYRFRSNSDTETVLYLYEEYGRDCVRRLNGMFAFAVWDDARQELFAARDHFGIKPLYYCHEGERLALASESKSFLSLPGFRRGLNFTALQQYLTFLWTPDPLTLFENVFKLPAGHCLTFRGGALEITKYWDLRFPDAGHRFTASEPELAEELRERFVAAVRSQMISDVPLGAFLSAGLDSSSIVAAMSAVSDSPVRTYTIGFPPKYLRGEVHLDDPAVARRTAEHFNCKHTEIIVEPDVVDLLPKLVWHMDEPTADPALIAAYLVSREARKEVTVLLSGIGGDELFGGYRKYRAHYWAEHYRRMPSALRRLLIEPCVGALPTLRGTSLKGYVRLAKKMVRSGSLSPAERFIMDSVYLTDEQKRRLYSDGTRARINGHDPRQRHLDYFAEVASADPLNQMLYVDTKAFMTSLNLTYNDKMSMASSVETRVPFLDWELAEWAAWNVPPRMKLSGGVTKYILRKAMGPLLPPEVLRQKKAGFGAPVDYWLAYDLKGMVDDLLGEEGVKRRGLFDFRSVRRMIEEQRQGREDWSLQIWQMLTLELWLREFID